MVRKVMKFVFAAVLAVCVSACTKDETKVMDSIAGSWHYDAAEHSEKIDVYLVLSPDNSFEMFQKIGEGAYWRSTGTFELNVREKTISGIYSDRIPWKNVYGYSVGSSTLTLSASGVSMKYVSSEVPEEVRIKSLDLTKSAEGTVGEHFL